MASAGVGGWATFRDNGVRAACDLVDRNFYADAPDTLWVAYIPYVPKWAGLLYLAVVLDAFSRRIVGWAMGHDLKTQLVLDALNMALVQRRPVSVIHHSDQGALYTSVAFGLRCKEVGVRPSMGSVGDAYDNAMCESFFATLECELLDRRKLQAKAEARMAVFQFVEGWYNPAIPPSATSHPSTTKGAPKPGSRTQALNCPLNRGNPKLLRKQVSYASTHLASKKVQSLRKIEDVAVRPSRNHTYCEPSVMLCC